MENLKRSVSEADRLWGSPGLRTLCCVRGPKNYMQADAVLISEIHPLSEQETGWTEDKSVRHPRTTFFLSILPVERCLEASVRRQVTTP